jgi:glutamate/tyrosine decarboxylase-like PLP-dependent enzyme
MISVLWADLRSIWPYRYSVLLEVGCALVRHEAAHRKTFSLTSEYLEHDTRGLAAGQLWFSDYGLQLSRQFHALKVWMSIKKHGVDRFGRMMARNVEQAHYLGFLNLFSS